MAAEAVKSLESEQNLGSIKKEVKEYDPNDPKLLERKKEKYKNEMLIPYPNPVGPNGPLNMKFSRDLYEMYLDPTKEASGSSEIMVNVGEDGSVEVMNQNEQNQEAIYINSIQVFDMSGKVVAKDETQQLLSNNQGGKINFNAPLAKGFYVVSTQLSDGTVINQKFVVDEAIPDTSTYNPVMLIGSN